MSVLCFWVGMFGVFDAVVEKKTKVSLSEFIFGFHDKSVKDFESGVIFSLLSVFVEGGRLRKKRVFLFSLAFAALSVGGLVSFIYAFSDEEFDLAFQVVSLIVLFFIFVVALISFPLDLYSLYVTKRLFWGKRSSLVGSGAKILLDIFLSILPLVIGGGLMLLSNKFSPIYGAALFQFPSVLAVSLVQIVVLVFGILLRSIIRLTKLNQYTVLYTNLHEAPFTFLGLVSGALAVTFPSIWL